MSEITFEEYKKAIRAHYEVKKATDVLGVLSNPTPAQVRDLCLYISENGLTENDEKIFRSFFNANGDEKLGRAITNFNTGKLKSVISFLKGKKNSESRIRIELASILVDFKPRPLRRFSQSSGTLVKIVDETFQENENDEIGDIPQRLEVVNKKKGIVADNKIKEKGIIIFIVFVFLFFMGYTAKNIFFPTKGCMQWKGNHYEQVECSNNQLGIGQLDLIVPVDEQAMELKKLDSEATLEFFKKGKPVIWYFKNNGKIELFNQPGFHPETEKPLKPITNYIIEKYHLKSKE